MGNKIGVIDLGTNTFHLLVVLTDQENATWREVYRKRQYIHLAEEGIETIGNAAFQRGLKALKSFAQKCQDLKVSKIKACGTAALRTASNGSEFVKKVFDEYKITIEIIDGIKEANYISKGVHLALPATNQSKLIMDIGGGSVEFILTKGNELSWAKSFPIGVAVLKKEFHHSDPIAAQELHILEDFLTKELSPIINKLANQEDLILVGASGTFDVLQNLLTKIDEGQNYSELVLDEFEELSNRLIEINLEERKRFPNLPLERAELIVVALVLIQTILKLHPFKGLFVSQYAMKEGILVSIQES